MDLDQLLTFERVVREGSFSKAAFSLGVAQPTVSVRIKALETHLGGPLFHRGRKVRLTERGESFLPYARRAITTLQDGREVARLAPQGGRGRLSVGVLHSLAGRFTGSALRSFLDAYPDVECTVHEGKHWDILEQLYDGVTEVGLLCWPPLDPLLAELTPLLHLREPVLLLASPNHPLAAMTSVRQEDVIALSRPLVFLRWWQATPRALARLCKQTNAADLPTETAKHLLRSGLGAGFFTKMVAAPELESGELVRIPVDDLPKLYRKSALVKLARREVLSPAAIAFVDYLKKVANFSELCV